ncbi:MAG TPA: OmpA family protein [Chitinophagaceae bacterium]|nr:OmpA family protein [Chitinophagaceae bacterium]
MAVNLIELAKNYFTSEFSEQAANKLGESSSGISNALSAIIPAGLAGILSKATSGADGASSIFNMAKEALGSFTSTPNANNITSANTGGNNILSGLFGGRLSGIISAVSNFAHIKESSAASLMSLGIPSLLGLLGKHAEQNNLTPGGLQGFLSSQKDHIINALPSGLSSVGGLLGSISNTAGSVTSSVKSAAGHIADEAKSTGNKWLLPLIIILIAIAILWYFLRGCNKTPETTTTPATDTSMVQKDTTTPTTTGPVSIKVKLPNGKELDALKGGIEDQLVTFLSGDWKSMSDSALKVKWFNFDNLNFETGTATLTGGSGQQLNNIAEILKAFPDAKIKIGGYTDATGNAQTNKKLSQERADTAKANLDRMGVSTQVVGAEGYGSEFAKYKASDPDSLRALDRHVSVNVRK